jgi:hypothetical protein
MNPALIVVILVGVPILVGTPFLDEPMPKLRLFVGRLGVTALTDCSSSPRPSREPG